MSSFIKYHLSISRDQYKKHRNAGLYKIDRPHMNNLSVKEFPPEYEIFSLLMERVGGPWGWPRRPRYSEEQKDDIINTLKKPNARLFLLKKGIYIIGHCLAIENNEELPNIPGTPSKPIIEIENFGFFLKHTGKNYGRYFLPILFDTLLEKHETIYLSTRSTNHRRVVPFYRDMGMSLFHQEIMPDDLLPENPAQTVANDEMKRIVNFAPSMHP